MSSPRFLTQVRQNLAVGTSLFALLLNLGAPVSAAAQPPAKQSSKQSTTTTPIQHVIVIIGENRTFDHVFATYQPTRRTPSRTCSRKALSMQTALPVPTSP